MELSEALDTIQKLRDENAKKRIENRELKEEYDTLKEKYKSETERVKTIETEKKELSEQFKEKMKEIESFSSEKTTLESELNKFKTEYDERRKNVLSKIPESLQATFSKLEISEIEKSLEFLNIKDSIGVTGTTIDVGNGVEYYQKLAVTNPAEFSRIFKETNGKMFDTASY